jgi:hypothetical protein
MTPSAPRSLGFSAFNPFLYAKISDDPNGMVLTVQSAFSRLNVDPREEAAELSRRPN